MMMIEIGPELAKVLVIAFLTLIVVAFFWLLARL